MVGKLVVNTLHSKTNLFSRVNKGWMGLFHSINHSPRSPMSYC